MTMKKSLLCPIDLTREASQLLCGGFTLESLYQAYFKKKLPNIFSKLIIPSVANMKAIENNKTPSEFKYPWDLITQNQKILQDNLKFKVEIGNYVKLEEGVYIEKEVKIFPNVVFKADKNSYIVIDNYSQILPFSYLEGPVFIGANSKICDHASIKHNVSIGNNCKVGGEVEVSIISNFSNKQHYGFLGHSYVGEWVNLGAGTTNSDLKNTYGEIKIDYHNQKVSTGELFLGCIISDFCKTAISTNIFTGKIIGVNSHLYGNVLSNIPSFINLTKMISGKNEEFRLNTAIEIQERMFKRRSITQTKKDMQILTDVFNLTKEKRAKFISEN